MSKKYVPTFLKGGASSEDKPIVNTSKPAMEAPKLAAATLASLTSKGAASASASASAGGSRSFADKFAEQAKQAADPNYVKPLNLESSDDFPALGGPKKANVVVKAWGTGANSFADKAKSWAKEAEEAEAKAKKKAEREARKAAEKERLRRMIPLIRKPLRNMHGDDSDEELEDKPYDDSSIGDSDSYESPEEPPSDAEEEENDEQYNGEIGYDGRRRGDIY